MLAAKTAEDRIAPRRNSREFPITPASNYPPLAASLWRWINRKEAEEDTYYQGLERHAAKIGVSSDKLRRFAMGITKRPTRADCILIARYFGKEEDAVLAMVGWDTYFALIEHVARHLPERADLLPLLWLSDTPLWRASDAEEKRYADKVLAGTEKLTTKAVLIADAIRSWAAKLPEAERLELTRQDGATRHG